MNGGQKLKFQKVRNRGGGVQTSTETTQRAEMKVTDRMEGTHDKRNGVLIHTEKLCKQGFFKPLT